MVKPEVEKALADIRSSFDGSLVTAREDGEGGAFIVVDPVDPGPLYQHRNTWIGFRITFQYPYADIYPHFVRGDLARVDGRPLGDGLSTSPTMQFEGRPAVQISRRSNRLNASLDTAVMKLQKVLQWLKTHP